MASAATQLSLTHLEQLEAESIHIFREVAAEFQKPVMLYSIGKDSSVMLRLAQKAFHPAPIPFPLLHVDTGYKFTEMIEFRDRYTSELGLDLLVWRNEAALAKGANPVELGTQRCCGYLKTQALLDGLREYGFDAAFGGARRDEERSRAKERIFSFRDRAGQWDPKNQRKVNRALRLGDGAHLVLIDVARVVEQPPDECRFAVIDAARGGEAKQILGLFRCQKFFDGELFFNGRHQKYPSRFLISIDPSWS